MSPDLAFILAAAAAFFAVGGVGWVTLGAMGDAQSNAPWGGGAAPNARLSPSTALRKDAARSRIRSRIWSSARRIFARNPSH